MFLINAPLLLYVSLNSNVICAIIFIGMVTNVSCVSVHLVDTHQTEQETTTAKTEALQAMQALKDRQQMAFEVCDNIFKALFTWATTKDIRYLLTAQRSLTAVQNQEGDT